jgi:hypothetical protein
VAFKQVYAVKLKGSQIDRLSMDWGGYGLEVPVKQWMGK